jgi:hypothetical protein
MTANVQGFAAGVELEFSPPGIAVWLCAKNKYNLPMSSYVYQAETKVQ